VILPSAFGLGHLGEIGERAAAADHHVGRERRASDRVSMVWSMARRSAFQCLRLGGSDLPYRSASRNGAERERHDLLHEAARRQDTSVLPPPMSTIAVNWFVRS